MRARDYPFFDRTFAAFAHRGGALIPDNAGIENSLAAFAHAVRAGYQYLETDVHTTRDGVLVAFHDERLDRATDGRGEIANHTAAALADVRIGGREPIPKLDELLDAFPTCRFNIDLKSARAIEPLARTIEAHRAHDRVCVASFGVDRIRAFRKRIGARVPTAVSSVAVAWNAFVPVLPRLLNSPGVAIQLPVSQFVGHTQVRVLTRRLIRHAHAAGKAVHVWTVDEADQMSDLIDFGVNGIFTDRPDVLKDVLVSRGLWEGPS